MRRIVNLRIMLVVAVNELLTIFILCLANYNLYTGITAGSVYLLGLVTVCVLSGKKRKEKLFAAFVLCIIFGAITCVSFGARLGLHYSNGVPLDKTCDVSGEVDAIATRDDGTAVSATIKNVRVNGEKARGEIQVVFENDVFADMISVSDKIEVSGRLYPVELIDGGIVNGNAYRKNIRYKIYSELSADSIKKSTGTGIAGVKSKLYKKLRLACGDRYGSIAYCMLTGDKSELDSATTRIYGLAGIGHVLAVSGLHVGIIVAVFDFILRRMKVSKIARVIVITVLLALYAFFVGLPASVLRAGVMCVIGLLTMVNGRQKDALSSVSAAFSLILAFEPFLLFEVGFLLSFSAVFGAVLFFKTFDSALRKIRFPKILSAPISLTASVHIGIFPVYAYFFGSFSTYSVLYNLLLIPLLSATFVLFVIVSPLMLLLDLNMLPRLCASGFAFADIISGTVEYLPLNSLYVNSNIGLFVLFPLYFAASGFFMLPRYKRTVSLCILALCAVSVAAPTIATLNISASIKYSVIPVNGYGDVTSVFVDDKVTVAGDCKDIPALRTALKTNGIRKIDFIAVNKLTESVGKGLAGLTSEHSVGKIACPIDNIESAGLAALGRYKRFYAFEETDFERISAVGYGDRHAGYSYSFADGLSVLTVGYSSRYVSVPTHVIDAAPVIRCFMYLDYAPDRVYLTNMPSGYLGEVPRYQFSCAEFGNFVYKVYDGEAIARR